MWRQPRAVFAGGQRAHGEGVRSGNRPSCGGMTEARGPIPCPYPCPFPCPRCRALGAISLASGTLGGASGKGRGKGKVLEVSRRHALPSVRRLDQPRIGAPGRRAGRPTCRPTGGCPASCSVGVGPPGLPPDQESNLLHAIADFALARPAEPWGSRWLGPWAPVVGTGHVKTLGRPESAVGPTTVCVSAPSLRGASSRAGLRAEPSDPPWQTVRCAKQGRGPAPSIFLAGGKQLY